MVLRCVYGRCNSDTRYPERLNGVKILPFPKPKTQYDRCLRWIEACGRPESLLNVHKIDRNKGVCTKHFLDASGPTKLHPDPVRWLESEASRERTPPRKKKKKSLEVKDQEFKQNGMLKKYSDDNHVDASNQTEEMWTPAWDMFALSAESQRLREELRTKTYEIEHLTEEIHLKNNELHRMAQILETKEKRIKHLEDLFHTQNHSE